MATPKKFHISDEVRAECLQHDVQIEAGTAAGLLTPRQIGVEAPARLYSGVYDVDLIGAYTYIGGRNTMLYHVGMIGRFCAIASNIHAGDAEHPTDFLSTHPIFQADPAWQDNAGEFFARNRAMIDKSCARRAALNGERFGKIQIGNDVWVGEGVFIRRGVEIGDGAIIGARSVVTRDVPPYAIVAGAPARLIRYRFEPDVIEELLRLQWWRYGLSALEGVDFTDIDMALWRIDENISSGQAMLHEAPILNVGQNAVEILRFDPATGAFTS
jgi:acetyltransferase-like isoleucine patch superfamily enzyme